MKKIISLLVIFLFHSNSFSQINFEKGYVVLNDGTKKECYIRNVDWKDNPTEFDYRLSLDSDIIKGNLKNVSEFSISNFSKFIRAEVGVDRASIDLDNYDFNRIPNLKIEVLFLKVLKESNVSLYSYQDASLNLYFIKANNKIEQLINKPYKVDNTKVQFYQYYKQQLSNAFDCNDAKTALEKISYNQSDLENVFERYYKCSGQTVEQINKNRSKSVLNFSIKPGLVMRSFAFERLGVSAANVNFGSKIVPRIGVEIETVLPFNRGKWALFAEPNFESYNFSKEIPIYGKVDVDGKVFNAPVGLRHYMFLNKVSKLFLNLAYNINLSSNSRGNYQNAYTDIKIASGNNFIAGLGCKYKKFTLEVRADFSSRNSTNYSDLESKSNALALLFGYVIF